MLFFFFGAFSLLYLTLDDIHCQMVSFGITLAMQKALDMAYADVKNNYMPVGAK